MVGSPELVKLVNNAVANITRRKILMLLAEGDREVGESRRLSVQPCSTIIYRCWNKRSRSKRMKGS